MIIKVRREITENTYTDWVDEPITDYSKAVSEWLNLQRTFPDIVGDSVYNIALMDGDKCVILTAIAQGEIVFQG